MTLWKMPPRAKVFEALSAIADDRITELDDTHANIQSSDRSKTYRVAWTSDLTKMTSNDNGSYWKGYVGYPMIAVLLLKGKLSLDSEKAKLLKGIPWKKWNDAARGDYEKVIKDVLSDLESQGASSKDLEDYVADVMKQLSNLKVNRL